MEAAPARVRLGASQGPSRRPAGSPLHTRTRIAAVTSTEHHEIHTHVALFEFYNTGVAKLDKTTHSGRPAFLGKAKICCTVPEIYHYVVGYASQETAIASVTAAGTRTAFFFFSTRRSDVYMLTVRQGSP